MVSLQLVFVSVCSANAASENWPEALFYGWTKGRLAANRREHPRPRGVSRRGISFRFASDRRYLEPISLSGSINQIANHNCMAGRAHICQHADARRDKSAQN